MNLKLKVGAHFIMIQWNQYVIVGLQEVEKKMKKKAELEKVSHMKRQGIKCEKGKIIDESWNIQVEMIH